jgi:hypothetical protein
MTERGRHDAGPSVPLGLYLDGQVLYQRVMSGRVFHTVYDNSIWRVSALVVLLGPDVALEGCSVSLKRATLSVAGMGWRGSVQRAGAT